MQTRSIQLALALLLASAGRAGAAGVDVAAVDLACDPPPVLGYLPGAAVSVACRGDIAVTGGLLTPAGARANLVLDAMSVTVDPAAGTITVARVDSRVVDAWTFAAGGAFDRVVPLTGADPDTGEPLGPWLGAQYALKRKLRLRLVVGVALGHPELDTSNNAFAVPVLSQGFYLTPLAGPVRFGAVVTTLTGGAVARVGASCCHVGPLQLTAGSALDWAPGATFAPRTVVLDAPLDVTPHAAGEVGLDLDAAGVVDVPAVTGTFGGLDGLVHASLDERGAAVTAFSVSLPPGHSWHRADASGRPTPRGRARLAFTSWQLGTPGDLTTLSGRLTGGFLHANDLPFYLAVQQLAASPSSVAGTFAGTRYVHDAPYGASDPRPVTLGVRQIPSNDVRFARDAAPAAPRALRLGADGLSARVSFGMGSGPTAFPRVGTAWGAFDLQVSGGRLKDGQALPADAFVSFTQSPDCPLCPTTAAGPVYTLTPVGAVGIGPDGGTVAVVQGAESPRWGPTAAAGGHVFERSGEAGHGVLYLPGFSLPGTSALGAGAPPPSPSPPAGLAAPVVAGRSAPEVLLGARVVDAAAGPPSPGAWYGATEAEAARGNHFAAGLTVGPERHADAVTGAPVVGLGADLSGSVTSVRLGGPDADGGCDGAPCAVVSDLGTRYVVRPGGVTGVFSADTPPSPTVYGHDLPFARFGFRQILNGIDAFSWIDGAVEIPAPGGFSVAYRGMTLTCAGALSDAPVPPCDPDAPAPLNCGEDLDAWRAAMTPRTLTFAPPPGEEACRPGDRELEVGADVAFAALDDVLGLTAVWRPDGTPDRPRVTGRADQALARPTHPSSPDDDRGYPISLHASAALEYDEDPGALYVNADFATPLFDAVNADVRLANEAVGVAAPTLVRAGDGSGAPDPGADWTAPCGRDDAGGCAPRAHYTWGPSGFALDLPVWFDLDADGARAPRFSGVTVAHGVGVMQVAAGVDYATPDEARVTFGASADFATMDLAALVPSVDVDDPDAIARVDALLVGVGVPLVAGRGPIAAAVEDVRAALDALLDVTGAAAEGQLRGVIEAQLDLALAEVGDAALDALVGHLNAARAFPAVVASDVVGALDATLGALLTPFTVTLDADADALVDLLVELVVAAGVTPCDALAPAACDDGLAAVRALSAAVDAARGLLDGLAGPGGGDVIVAVRAAVDQRVLELRADLDAARTWVASLRDDALGAPDVARLETPSVTVNPLLAFLVVGLVPEVAATLEAVEDLDLADNLARLSDLVPLPSGLERAEAGLVGRAGELLDEYALTLPAFAQDLELIDLSRVLDGPLALLAEVDAHLDAVDLALDQAAAEVDGALADLEAEITARVGALDAVSALLDRVERGLLCAQDPACSAAELVALLDAAPRAWLDAQLSLATDGAVAAFGELGATFVLAAPDWLREPFDAAVAEVTTALEGHVAALATLPAFSTGADLRATLVDLVMAAGGVEAALLSLTTHFDLLVDEAGRLADDVFAQVEAVLADLAVALGDAVAGALAAATATVDGLLPDLPVTAAAVDGYAVIAGDELERLHVGAAFTMTGSQEDDTRSFEGALDVTRWDTEGEGAACAGGAGAPLDAVISASDLPLRIGPGEVTIKDLHLGFTLDGDGSGPPSVVGLFGGISVDGSLKIGELTLYDLALEAGAGPLESYLGATAAASFSSMSLSVAFLVGRTCGDDVLAALDPQAAELVTLPGGVFNGVYVRGAASMPIIDLGCLLNLSLTADIGTWLLGGPPLTVGGLVGGGAYGKLGCIGALRGQATAFAEKSGDRVKFAGEGFAVAGVGLDCDPETWTTVQRSRDDKKCGTGDAKVKLTFDGGHWSVPKPDVSAVH